MSSEIQKYLGSLYPIEILKNWLQEARNHEDIKEPTAMILSTVFSSASVSKAFSSSSVSNGGEVIPFSRVVLVKEITEEGVIFYTNSKSRKGDQLDRNSFCCGHFYWDPLFKQVSIIGRACKVPRSKTESYWQTRLRESQLSQWVSNQSEVIESREVLNQKVKQAKEKWEGKEIECPQNWSGYHVSVESIEFWIGRDHRLHDRFLFKKENKTQWNAMRLSP